MPQTPYSPRDPFAAPEPVEAQQRVSGLAVGAIITSLLCCIPGVGAVGAVLAVAAMVKIGRSEGRLGGRTLAFVALLLGILGTIGWVAIAVGVRQAVNIYQREMISPVVSAAQFGEQGDWSLYRRLLTPATSAAVADADFDAFREAYRAEFGPFVGPVGAARGSPGSSPSAGQIGPGDFRLPVPVAFTNRAAFIVLKFSSPDHFFDIFFRGSSLDGRLENVGVSGRNGVIWLIDPARKPTP